MTGESWNKKAGGADGRRTAFVGIVTVLLFTPLFALAAPGKGSDTPSTTSASGRQPPTNMREAVLHQRRLLQSEKAELEQLKIDLKAAEAGLDRKIKALQAENKKKEDLIQQLDALHAKVQDKKLTRLVRLTEKMPPPEAAAYLSKLDEPTASSILQGMRVRQASKVMAALHPKKAASLSRTYLKNDKPVGRRSGGNQPKPR